MGLFLLSFTLFGTNYYQILSRMYSLIVSSQVRVSCNWDLPMGIISVHGI